MENHWLISVEIKDDYGHINFNNYLVNDMTCEEALLKARAVFGRNATIIIKRVIDDEAYKKFVSYLTQI